MLENKIEISNEEYWKQRCFLAENCLAEMPYERETKHQIKVWEEYYKFIRQYGTPLNNN